MRFKILLSLLAVLVVTQGCQKPENKTAGESNVGRNTRADGWTNGFNSSGPAAEVKIAGRFFGQNNYDFMDAARALVNASIPEDYLGDYISGGYDNNNDTGIFFGGQVALSTGAISTTGGSASNATVHPKSRLLIAVYDNLVGQTDGDGGTIGPVAIYLQNAQGTIQGNRAQIRFSDEYGVVELDGAFDSQYYTGVVRFENEQSIEGGVGGAGQFEEFVIPTCEFFACR